MIGGMQFQHETTVKHHGKDSGALLGKLTKPDPGIN